MRTVGARNLNATVKRTLAVCPGRLQRRSKFLVCQFSRTSVQIQEATTEVLVRATDLRNSVQLRLVNEGRGQAIEIQYVSEGSAAEEAGLKAGQRLRGIEDPIRSDQMYELGDRPSLNFVLDAIRMSRHTEIKLKVEQTIYAQDPPSAPPVALPVPSPSQSVAAAEVSNDRSLSVIEALDSLTGTASSSSLTIAEQLEQKLLALEAEGSLPAAEDGYITLPLGSAPQPRPASEDSSALNSLLAAQSTNTDGIQPKNEVQARIKRRKDYLDQVSQRNDTGFFSWLFGAFVLPPAVILGLAYASGYMDTLYTNTLAHLH